MDADMGHLRHGASADRERLRVQINGGAFCQHATRFRSGHLYDDAAVALL